VPTNFFNNLGSVITGNTGNKVNTAVNSFGGKSKNLLLFFSV